MNDEKIKRALEAQIWKERLPKILEAIVHINSLENRTAFFEYSGHVERVIVRVYACEHDELGDKDIEPVYRKEIRIDGEFMDSQSEFYSLIADLRSCTQDHKEWGDE